MSIVCGAYAAQIRYEVAFSEPSFIEMRHCGENTYIENDLLHHDRAHYESPIQMVFIRDGSVSGHE